MLELNVINILLEVLLYMSTSLQVLDLFQPIDCLDLYTQTIKRIPMLSAEEELDLARRLYTQGDLIAARRLILSNLRFVAKIARGYAGYGLQQGDLIQEGNIGLMKAVKRFNPEIGVRLVSFAVHWIRAEIHEFILRNWRIVKVATTKAQRKLFFNLRRSKPSLGWFNHEEIQSVAKELGVSPKVVQEMEQRMAAHDTHFDLPVNFDEDEGRQGSLAPIQYLQDSRYDPARLLEFDDSTEHDNQGLHAAMATLDPRSQDILNKRWLADDKATLQDLAAKYQVSAERIRQLEQNAMKKLKEAIGNESR